MTHKQVRLPKDLPEESPENEVVPLRYGRDLAVKENQMHLPGYTVISAGIRFRCISNRKF